MGLSWKYKNRQKLDRLQIIKIIMKLLKLIFFNPISLNVLAIILKPLHLFYVGWRECWFVLVFDRNTIILLICFSTYWIFKNFYNKFKQFKIFIMPRGLNLYSEFLKNYRHILNLLKCNFIFWLFSFLFSNLDLLLSYHGLARHWTIYLAELLPYVYIFYKTSTIFYKWIKGD